MITTLNLFPPMPRFFPHHKFPLEGRPLNLLLLAGEAGSGKPPRFRPGGGLRPPPARCQRRPQPGDQAQQHRLPRTVQLSNSTSSRFPAIVLVSSKEFFRVDRNMEKDTKIVQPRSTSSLLPCTTGLPAATLAYFIALQLTRMQKKCLFPSGHQSLP